MENSGLFDFQVNGFGGVDFQRDAVTPAELRIATAALKKHGTTSIFVTLTTAPIDNLCRRFEAFERARALDPDLAKMFVGYHLEGPWISLVDGYRGAHSLGPVHAPSDSEFQRLQSAAGGRIKLLTLAPEWPGSPEFISRLTQSGVNVSLGHTNANDAEIDAAIKAGARFATHLGNGAPLSLHRHDNIIQRLLARDELIACFIPDGIHLPPFVLRNFFRAKPRGKALFTTDAMAGAGAPPGRYTIGELEISIGEDRVARQPGGGGFAGSTLAPDEGVRNTASFLGIDLAAAQALWSDVARRAFGVS